MSGEQGGAGRREVAYRVFAAEYDDASLEHAESDEERAPNYVVTPTGARVNRLFVVGVLTEVESVSEDVLRGRVVDPTGAFVVYAGQYQPDAQTFLERAEPPAFVAVTGKARAFRPDDSDRVLTSIRPESINEVDAETRDRWTVQASSQTLERVAAFARALDRPERGPDLRAALLDSGVDYGLAAGISLAIDHYGTTTAYLDALRETAIGAAEVVAGERDGVEPLELAPGEGGEADVDLSTAGGPVESPEPARVGGESGTAAGTATDAAAGPGATGAEPGAEPSGRPTEAAGTETGGGTTDAPEPEEPGGIDGMPDPDEPGEGEPSAGDPAGASDPAEADEGDGEASGEGDGPGEDVGDLGDFEEFEGEAATTDEMYELDEGERAEIEAEYGTEFTTGGEVDAPGEADIETPTAEGTDPGADGTTESARSTTPPGDQGGDRGGPDREDTDREDTDAGGEPGDAAEPGPDAPGPGDAGSGAPDGEADDVDLEAAVVEAMRDLDDGDGADREAVIEAVVDEHGVEAGAVEEAIQDALMSGKCYEPSDGRLTAI